MNLSTMYRKIYKWKNENANKTKLEIICEITLNIKIAFEVHKVKQIYIINQQVISQNILL